MASERDIQEYLAFIDGKIEKLSTISVSLQARIYKIVRNELLSFSQEDGTFIPEQDLNVRLIDLQNKIEKELNLKVWKNGIGDFLQTFQTIQDRTIGLQKAFNNIDVPNNLLTPSRQFIYEQAKYKLTTSVRSEYVEPVKFLVMQQVTNGSSIQDGLKMLERWNEGQLSQGKYTNNNPAPNLQKYATQIARDTAYSADRTMNGIIKERYGLTHFVYVGGVIQDTRPLCRALVSYPQPVAFSELPALIYLYPQGLIDGTNQQNFIENCGGYNCRHKAMPVRAPRVQS